MMERLPVEILSDIFQLVKLDSRPSALTACALCCKSWRDIVLPVFYRDVVLNNARLKAFAAAFSTEYGGPLVRSLTLAIDPENDDAPPAASDGGAPSSVDDDGSDDDDTAPSSADDGSSANSRDLWRRLENLFAAVSSMTKLVSFSLTVTDAPTDTGFWLPRPLIASFVTRLPATCVDIEIDTNGHDFGLPGGSVHLCDTLRGVLPRLRHLRLRLKVLCAALFVHNRQHEEWVTGVVAAGAPADIGAEGGVAAPALKTLVLNCATQYNGIGSHTRVCGALGREFDDGENPRRFVCYFPLPPARFELARCLSRLYTTGGGDGGGGGASPIFPAIERLWMLDVQPPDDDDRSVYAVLNRRDVAADKTYVMPFDYMRRRPGEVFMARMPDGREVLSDFWAIEALAEGETWVEMLGGARVPATEATPDQGWRRVKKPLPLCSTQEYRGRFPSHRFTLWNNEDTAGIKLLSALERDGLTDTAPVRELTPPGWSKNEHGCLEPLQT
jgi:hypothetical protein